MLSKLKELLEPYDHEIMEKPGMYWVRLEKVVMSFDWRTLMHFESPTYDIHHTEECLEAQECFYAFKNFVEDFGGYVPDGTCDCPRDEIPADPDGKAKMIFHNLLNKHLQSLEESTNE